MWARRIEGQKLGFQVVLQGKFCDEQNSNLKPMLHNIALQASKPQYLSIIRRKCTMSFWKSSFMHKTCSWALQLFSSDHTRPITQEKFVTRLTITQPMLVLYLGTIHSLFFKIKQPSHNTITQKSFMQNLSVIPQFFPLRSLTILCTSHTYHWSQGYKIKELWH